jgi:Uma2 family endonuclease
MNVGAFLPPRLFTVTEYYLMAEAGILMEDDRVELIEGVVVEMGPIGPRHAACVTKTSGLLRAILTGGLAVSAQNPVRLNDHSEPQPDVAVLRARDDLYAAQHPGPESIFLLIEVADASLMYDRNTKLPLYARWGIGEIWLVDLVGNVVDVYSSPEGNVFTRTQRYQRGSTVASVVLPQIQIAASEILVG